jgi:hypothetical protein
MLLAAALASVQAIAQEIAVPPPFQPGMAWSYRQREEVSGQETGVMRFEVVAVAADRLTVDVALTGEESVSERWDNAGNWAQTGTRGWAWLARLGGASKRVAFTPPLALYRFPLQPGKSWVETTRAVDPESGRSTEVRVFAKAIAWEEVTVPAGKFNALKVRRAIVPQDADATRSRTTVTLIDWYSPQVAGPVKRICDWEHNDYRRAPADQLVRGLRLRLELAEFVPAR